MPRGDGTGKTTIAVGLALSLENVQFLDCDVEEPNAHIFLKPEITHTEWVNIPVPKVNEDRCTYCGKCAEICVYNAIAVIKERVLLFSELCHGCGGCSLLCPEDAIEEVGRPIGVLEKGKSGSISFTHGKLNLGEALAVPLVRAVKRASLETHPNNNQFTSNNEITIIDVPPGTSCPVIESVKGSDFCLLATEPTLSGIHDLERIVGVTHHFGIKGAVCINKYDLNLMVTRKIEEYCRNNNIELVGRIPFDTSVTEALVRSLPIVEHSNNQVTQQIKNLWEKILEI